MADVPLTTTGVPETVLPPEPPEFVSALKYAHEEAEHDRRDAIARVVAHWPAVLSGWVELAKLGKDQIANYAYHRVAYHRGLDSLRKNGWRGSGYVRWKEPSNRPFLRALEGLRRSAEEIGETEEAQRCAEFLRQLDPDWGTFPLD